MDSGLMKDIKKAVRDYIDIYGSDRGLGFVRFKVLDATDRKMGSNPYHVAILHKMVDGNNGTVFSVQRDSHTGGLYCLYDGSFLADEKSVIWADVGWGYTNAEAVEWLNQAISEA